MTVAFWCLFIALFLPYVATGIAKYGDTRFKASDNHDPRAFFNNLSGFAKRANSAQLNGFEVNPAFFAAVIVAHLAGGSQQVTQDVLAVLFVTSRLLYLICYLADWAALRSAVWVTGMGLIAALFITAA